MYMAFVVKESKLENTVAFMNAEPVCMYAQISFINILLQVPGTIQQTPVRGGGVQRADRDPGLGWASWNPFNSKTATIVKNTVH